MLTKQCPHCGEKIKADALKCHYCREWLELPESTSPEDISEINDETISGISFDKKEEEIPIITTSFNSDSSPPLYNDNEKATETTLPYELPSTGRLIVQNFKLAKQLSLALIILPIICIILKTLAIISSPTTPITLSILAITVAMFVIAGFLLEMLNTYMQNFNISKNFTTGIRIIQICVPLGIVLLTVGSVQKAIYFLTTAAYALLILSYIAFILAGKCIYNLEQDDFIGGSHILGGMMFWGFLLPVLWYSVPVLTYRLFTFAHEYDKMFEPGYQPKNTAKNTGNYLLKKQNFVIAMVISVIMLITPLVALITYKNENTNILIFNLVLTFIVYPILLERLLAMLGKYMSNFDISRNFAINIKYVRISLAAIFLSWFIFLPLYIITKIELFGILAVLILFIAFFTFYFTFVLAGKCIYNMYDEDFVGGSEPLGAVMFFGLLFPPVWLLVPLFAFISFQQARKHSKEYGFIDA